MTFNIIKSGYYVCGYALDDVWTISVKSGALLIPCGGRLPLRDLNTAWWNDSRYLKSNFKEN